MLVDLTGGNVLTRTGGGFRNPQLVQFLHNDLGLLVLWVGTHGFVPHSGEALKNTFLKINKIQKVT